MTIVTKGVFNAVDNKRTNEANLKLIDPSTSSTSDDSNKDRTNVVFPTIASVAITDPYNALVFFATAAGFVGIKWIYDEIFPSQLPIHKFVGSSSGQVEKRVSNEEQWHSAFPDLISNSKKRRLAPEKLRLSSSDPSGPNPSGPKEPPVKLIGNLDDSNRQNPNQRTFDRRAYFSRNAVTDIPGSQTASPIPRGSSQMILTSEERTQLLPRIQRERLPINEQVRMLQVPAQIRTPEISPSNLDDANAHVVVVPPRNQPLQLKEGKLISALENTEQPPVIPIENQEGTNLPSRYDSPMATKDSHGGDVPHSRLSSDQRRELDHIVRNQQPSNHGFPGRRRWTPSLLSVLSEKLFGVSYSESAAIAFLKRRALTKRYLRTEEQVDIIQALQAPATASGFSQAEWTYNMIRQYVEERFQVELASRRVQQLAATANTPYLSRGISLAERGEGIQGFLSRDENKVILYQILEQEHLNAQMLAERLPNIFPDANLSPVSISQIGRILKSFGCTNRREGQKQYYWIPPLNWQDHISPLAATRPVEFERALGPLRLDQFEELTRVIRAGNGQGNRWSIESINDYIYVHFEYRIGSGQLRSRLRTLGFRVEGSGTSTRWLAPSEKEVELILRVLGN